RAMETTVNLITGPTQQDTGATSGGSANAQTVTLATTPTLALGLSIAFTAGFSNTGATTLNPNGLGAIPLQKGVPAADLVAGDLIAGADYIAYCNGAAFKLVPFGGVQIAAGYLQMKSIFVQGSPEQQLTPVTPEIYNASWVSSATGKPRTYTLDADAIR